MSGTGEVISGELRKTEGKGFENYQSRGSFFFHDLSWFMDIASRAGLGVFLRARLVRKSHSRGCAS